MKIATQTEKMILSGINLALKRDGCGEAVIACLQPMPEGMTRSKGENWTAEMPSCCLRCAEAFDRAIRDMPAYKVIW